MSLEKFICKNAKPGIALGGNGIRYIKHLGAYVDR